MTVPLGAVAPPRPRRRARDLELAGVGVVALVTSIAVTAVQTRWVRGWDDSSATGASSLVLVLPPLALGGFGFVLAVMGWRRRPFRGFWDTSVPLDHVRRALLFASLVLVVIDITVVGRLGLEIVRAVERTID